jgi:lipopolysaccharide transport system permease protein
VLPTSGEAVAPAEPPPTRIRAVSGWRLPDLRELWLFRDVMMMLGVRDLKVRYKQTLLGVSWVILQPLLAAGIFSFVFGGVAQLEAPGDVPYFIFSYVGLLAWNLFSNTVNRSSGSLLGNKPLIQKVYTPRLLLPLSNLLSSLVDFAVAATLLVGMLVLFWELPGLSVLAALGTLVLFLLFALGLGLAAAATGVYFRDVRYLVPVLLQFLLYASPVAYAVDAVPEEYEIFYLLNPLAGLLETFRWAVLGVGELSPFLVVYPLVTSLVVFVGGVLFFKRLESGFADVI